MQTAMPVKSDDGEDLEADAAQRVHAAVGAAGAGRKGFARDNAGCRPVQGEVALGPRPVERRVERRLHRREHLVDLGLGDDHRRAEGEDVADRPADDAARHQLLRHPRRRPCPAPRSPSATVRRQLERAHQAEVRAPRRPADARPAGRGARRSAGASAADPRRRCRCARRSRASSAPPRRRPDGRRRCSRGRRCRSCRSSPRSPRPCRASIATADSGRKPAVSCFAIDSEFGAIAERLRAEPFAGAAEAADHLVGDHQEVVPAADRADRLEVALAAAR